MENKEQWKKTSLRCYVPLALTCIGVAVGTAAAGRVMVMNPYSKVSGLPPHKCGITCGWSDAGGSTGSLRPLGDGNVNGSRRGGGSAAASMFTVIGAGSLHAFIDGSGRGKRRQGRDLGVRVGISGSQLLLRC
jgi:hypothetical protein